MPWQARTPRSRPPRPPHFKTIPRPARGVTGLVPRGGYAPVPRLDFERRQPSGRRSQLGRVPLRATNAGCATCQDLTRQEEPPEMATGE
eukprot:8954983-Pyramimonas_sp.AAC.1